MRFVLYIAWRYLFAKKSHNIINIISAISVAGIAIGTMALITVLSVFNGFEGLVVSLFNSFNPDIRISARVGKTFSQDDFPLEKVLKIPGVAYYSEVLEENALLRYKDKQYIVTIKGVMTDFEKTSRIKEMIIDGDFYLDSRGVDYAVVGQGIAYNLDLSLDDPENPLTVFVPRKDAKMSIDPTEAFNSMPVYPAGVFSIQQDFDIKYVILSILFVRQLLDRPNESSAIEIALNPDCDKIKTQKEIQSLLGDKYVVKNRFQQEELLYKIMKSEKLAVFMILSFILLIAIFNVIGSLSMLILEKKKDIAVLKSLGANENKVRSIFLAEGMMISLLGGVIGLIAGFGICLVQQIFGIITIGASDSFVVQAYPVRIMGIDFIVVFCIVLVIGFVAAWYPVKYISRKYLDVKLA